MCVCGYGRVCLRQRDGIGTPDGGGRCIIYLCIEIQIIQIHVGLPITFGVCVSLRVCNAWVCLCKLVRQALRVGRTFGDISVCAVIELLNVRDGTLGCLSGSISEPKEGMTWGHGTALGRRQWDHGQLDYWDLNSQDMPLMCLELLLNP